MLIIKMAFRNILKHRRRSAFSIAAMCIGFILTSLALCMNIGGYQRMIDMVTAESTGHLQIHAKGYLENPSLYKRIEKPSEVINALNLDKDKVIGWTSRIYSGALAFFKKKTQGVRLIGINVVREGALTGFSKRLVSGRALNAGERGILVSKSIAKALKIGVGSDLILISSGADGSIANDSLKVVGILNMEGSMLGDSAVIMPMPVIQEFLGMYNEVHELIVMAYDGRESISLSKLIASKLGSNLEVHPWQKVLNVFYRSMRADQKGSYVFIFIIMFVVGIVVLNTILLGIYERIREYGLIKALGARPWQVFKLILAESTMLAALGLIPASLLSLWIDWYFSTTGIKYDTPIEYGGVRIEAFRGIIQSELFWIPALMIMVTAVLVSIWPAIRASKTDPAKIMREV